MFHKELKESTHHKCFIKSVVILQIPDSRTVGQIFKTNRFSLNVQLCKKRGGLIKEKNIFDYNTTVKLEVTLDTNWWPDLRGSGKGVQNFAWLMLHDRALIVEIPDQCSIPWIQHLRNLNTTVFLLNSSTLLGLQRMTFLRAIQDRSCQRLGPVFEIADFKLMVHTMWQMLLHCLLLISSYNLALQSMFHDDSAKLMTMNQLWFANLAVIGLIWCYNLTVHEPCVTELAHVNAIPLARFCDCTLHGLASMDCICFRASLWLLHDKCCSANCCWHHQQWPEQISA